MRVVKPGGKIVIVDYALPRWWHPLRYLWRPLLARLEPCVLSADAVGLMSSVDVPMVCAAMVMKSLYRSISSKIMP